MSNVLIGIIGVILFIGLALAGALFLGERFSDVVTSSKASAMMSNVSQFSDAITLYKLENGTQFPAGHEALLVPGYMKQLPVNSVDASWTFSPATKEGTYSGDTAFGFTGMPINEDNEKICQAINRTLGIALVDGHVPVLTAFPGWPAGCFKSQSLGALPNDMYVIFKSV